MKYIVHLFVAVALCLSAGMTYAQENTLPDNSADNGVYLQGTVLEVLETSYPIIHGREVEYQSLRLEMNDGAVREDIYNDYTPVGPGDVVWVSPWYDYVTETEGYFVQEVRRLDALLWVALIFVVTYLLVAGIKGLRSLLGLGVAVLAVWFVLLPMLQAGYDPLWGGVGISAIILGAAMFITHGFTIVSSVSYVGSMIAIIVTVGFAVWAMQVGNISGFVGDSVNTLSLLYGSTLDIYRLLLAGMIIGLLGVLDDVAVMQAAVVREFMSDRGGSSVWDVFVRGMKVGREHAAALVNTLVLAYTAVALPLFLVVFAPAMRNMEEYTTPLSMVFSNELFVIEFIRSMVGSFGLVLTVPIVTALAVLLYNRYPPVGPGPDYACAHHHH